MARNLKFYRDENDVPCARGPHNERPLTTFLETDIQDDAIILQALLDDLWAVENGYAESREFFGNAHSVIITADMVSIESEHDEQAITYQTKFNHFREVLLDWEAFI